MPTIRRAVHVTLACTLALSFVWTVAPAGGRSKYVDLDRFPKPRITGKKIIAGLEDFVSRFPMRQEGTPNNVARGGVSRS